MASAQLDPPSVDICAMFVRVSIPDECGFEKYSLPSIVSICAQRLRQAFAKANHAESCVCVCTYAGLAVRVPELRSPLEAA